LRSPRGCALDFNDRRNLADERVFLVDLCRGIATYNDKIGARFRA
jgi:hypothetical protein